MIRIHSSAELQCVVHVCAGPDHWFINRNEIGFSGDYKKRNWNMNFVDKMHHFDPQPQSEPNQVNPAGNDSIKVCRAATSS